MQEDFPSGRKPGHVRVGDGFVLILEADQHVAGVESKHHGQRGPAHLSFQPCQGLVGVGQKVGEHAAHIAAGWVLLQGLDQAGKVGGDLFLVHFKGSITHETTQTAGKPRQCWPANSPRIR